MKLTNKQYDFLKWFALVFTHAAEVLILTLGIIWGLLATQYGCEDADNTSRGICPFGCL